MIWVTTFKKINLKTLPSPTIIMDEELVVGREIRLQDLLAGYCYYSFLALNPQRYARLFHDWGRRRGQNLSSHHKLPDLAQLWPSAADLRLDDFLTTGNLIRKSIPSPVRFDVGHNLCYYTRGVLEGYLSQSPSSIESIKEVDCIANGGKHCHFVASDSPSPVQPPDLSQEDWQMIKTSIATEILHTATREEREELRTSPEPFLGLSEIAEQISTSALKLVGQDFGHHLGKALREPQFNSYLNLGLQVAGRLGWSAGRTKSLGEQGLLVSCQGRSDLTRAADSLWLTGYYKGVLEEFTNTEWNVSRLGMTNGRLRFKCRNL